MPTVWLGRTAARPVHTLSSDANGEGGFVAQGGQVLVDGGGSDAVPPVAEEKCEAHRCGEEEVDAWMAVGGAARGSPVGPNRVHDGRGLSERAE
jgi:hypothetical protein